jgi:hypothetical protein
VSIQRDAEIVEWIGRLGAAGVGHVVAHMGISRKTAYTQLGTLTKSGLLMQHRILHLRPALLTATRKGLRWRGLSGLGTCEVSAARFEHAYQIADAAVALAAGLPDWQILSEREILWREREQHKMLASIRAGPGNGYRPSLHRPDLALFSPTGRVVAIEVELAQKHASRLVTICNGWARARHVDAVYYLASPKAARAVGRAVRKTRAEDWVKVLALEQTAEVVRIEREATANEGDENGDPSPHASAPPQADTLPPR